MKPRYFYGVILVLAVVGLIFISGCINETDSEAPGCGSAGIVPTGCLGKSTIKDVKIEPPVECLKLRANNCNGGVLGIENRCSEDLEIGGKIIYADSYKLVEFVRDQEGKKFVIEPPGNFDSYNPEDEDLLSVNGTLGEKEVTISYVKKNVCGTSKTPDIPFLKMNETSFSRNETIKASVESEKMQMIFTGFPAFEIYQLIDGEWHNVDIYGMFCALPCSVDESEICGGIIACAPLPEHCLDFDPFFDKFEWDQFVYKTRNVECPNLSETRSCSFKEKAQLGTYKVVFQYSENCVDEDLFHAEENNVQEIEKQFEIL